MGAGLPALARKRRAVSVVAAGAAMALLALAAVAISDSNERTELVYRSSLDNTLNPAAGSGKGGWATGDPMTSWGPGSLEETYTGENADAPGIPSSYLWATSNDYDPSTGETGLQEGHGPDWIYQGGPPPGPIKGSRSHYYNEWKWDSDPETGGDFVAGSNVPEEDLQNENFVANEQSYPDHKTSEPYTHESSYGVLEGGIDGEGGRSAVENILNFDDWLMDSNGIY